jgi:hypothetical protein
VETPRTAIVTGAAAGASRSARAASRGSSQSRSRPPGSVARAVAAPIEESYPSVAAVQPGGRSQEYAK